MEKAGIYGFDLYCVFPNKSANITFLSVEMTQTKMLNIQLVMPAELETFVYDGSLH